MKSTNEKVIWNTQDTKLIYVPKANVDQTINGQETAVSTLDHSATTPMACTIWYSTVKAATHFS